MNILIVLTLLACATAFKHEGPIKHQIHHRSRVDEDRIVGGIPAGMTEFPYMVSLTKSTHWLISFHHFCGGAILSSTRVLTAAQCTYGTQTDSLRVEVGKYYLNNNLPGHEGVVGVDKAVEHPEYNPQTVDNDFAVLKLSAMLNFNTYVQPIRLGAIKLGDFVTAVGWGYTNEYGPLSNTLLKITVPVLPNVDCNVHDAYNGKITSNMLCAGYLGLSGYDSCQGDSGGPLTVGTGKNATLVGIASWGEGCGRLEKPGIYARVSSAKEWILSV